MRSYLESVQVWVSVDRMKTQASRALKRLKYKDEVQSMETRMIEYGGGETPGKYSYRISEVKLP